MPPRQRRPRRYTQGARADSAAATHRRILEAAITLVGRLPYESLTLAQVAEEAQVTVQTVLRRFGSKEGLTEAATALGVQEVRGTRLAASPGDVTGAMAGLAEHYEAWGERSLHLLAQERTVPTVRRITDAGRALHHDWVDQVFSPRLAALPAPVQARTRAALIAATDVFVWKVLRVDLSLDARACAQVMRELVQGVLD
ncbi:MAG: TetR/AcrR family transcriptional regulator [Myxococcaceae bacterium]|nr:TetR/AcrR family transcriptional regulator [Myxococcaceae bacterium]